MDADLQQRAVEYAALVNDPARAAQHYVLPMPKWEERESMLLRRLQQQEGGDDEASSPTAGGLLSPRGGGEAELSSAVAGGRRTGRRLLALAGGVRGRGQAAHAAATGPGVPPR
jgi:hypothetical protein